MFRLLHAFASLPLADTRGYGWFDHAGVGPEASWRAHLAKLQDEEPGFFFGAWHALYETRFLERERFQRYHARMLELLAGLDTPRALVHGSCSAYTLWAEDGQLTAVRDWQDARWGDPLFDLATLDFWPTGHDLPGLFLEYSAGQGCVHPGFRRRITAYKYYQALGSMSYFAKLGHREGYQSVVKLAEDL